MHLPDGILPPSISGAGFVLTGAGLWFSARMIRRSGESPEEGVPRASVMTAAFFAVSLIHVPFPPTSIHLMLNGLIGIVLGWWALPAVFTGLFFQAAMFGHGGLTALGANTVIIGFPAVLSGLLFRGLRMNGSGFRGRRAITFAGFSAGAVGPLLSAAMSGVLLAGILPAMGVPSGLSGSVLWLPLAMIPLAALEGAFSSAVTLFLVRVKPSILGFDAVS